MKPLKSLATLMMVCACTSSQVKADTLMQDNFQNGDLAGWSTSGTAYANYYYGNYSLGLRGVGSSASYALSTVGYVNVNISLDISAYALEYGDRCIAEVSNDGGNTWVNAITLYNGQDNSALYNAASVPIDADNKSSLLIRYRTSVNQYYDYCYGDNVLVTGDVDTSGGDDPGGGNDDFYDELTGSGSVTRTLLSYSTLMSGGDPGTRIDLSGYALPADAAHPQNAFAGTLTLNGEASGGGFFEHKDTYNYTGAADDTRKHLPEFSFQFIQTGSHIFPLERGSIASTHPDWEYVLAPGRVWQENGDNGYSRVAIPFALQQRNANCMHNGVMSFLFRDDGAVSRVAYQISSETCLYFKADWWGLLDASYTPESIAGQSQLIADYQAEIAARLPVKPLSALNTDYPGTDYTSFASPSGTDPSHISTAGFVIDGTHYRGTCTTRNGDYPYCESLLLPSYSTAKSLFGGVAMMRLEKQYPGVRNTIVSSYVSSCNNGTWSDVTLDNVLDMATGNYDSSNYMEDEGAAHTDNLFLVDSHASKLSYSCGHYARKAAPGSLWVYHTSDTYIAGSLMNAYLQNQQGGDADIFTDTLVEDLLKPIGVGPTGQYTRRTYDTVAQPFTGWGLMWLPDDIAKIASFVGIDDGQIGGQPMLDAAQLDAALQRSPTDTGTVPLADYRYNNGFWAHNVAGSLTGCSGAQWIPFLSGYGGITVVLLPNDSVYYYFSDNDTYYWLEAVQEAHGIRSACQ
ncbi:hypothetical protein AWR36_007795 [Microbulbifer flavimaris]|uniref:Beta-lactamase-related domain-containing protein n=1 Tax=Microbulbifer flavimaris TaxID=1781068 RepID=A0ABX4I125_9GAMM|nr:MULTISPECIES: hypothetical protein [Microbulbifer]KUJ83722.1 hypothetical protein AVO43_07770 [Microbulbifer sp. ZGT114]PCO05893.1 hypothetical protein AWR36_007795 [Microbulbifer flavimaris]